MNIGYKKQLGISFEVAEKKIRQELANEGFGVITEINAKETFKKKLNVEFENYLILGACQPASAYGILQKNKELGLLLPCNVLVYEENGLVFASAILPTVALGMVGDEELMPMAQEIEQKLKKVIDAM